MRPKLSLKKLLPFCQDPCERLVKKYFWFLVEQYGFIYETPYRMRSEKIHIQFEFGHKTPWIFICLVGEPESMRLGFDRIIQYFEGFLLGEKRDYTAYSLEENMRFDAEWFKKYADKIVYEIDEWWLPVHVFEYRLMEKRKEWRDHEAFLFGYKDYYEYLKSKGAIE